VTNTFLLLKLVFNDKFSCSVKKVAKNISMGKDKSKSFSYKYEIDF